MHQDGISETVAYFIGLFATHEEAARLRHDYDEFHRGEAGPQAEDMPDPQHGAPRHQLDLGPNNPVVKYKPGTDDAHVPSGTPPVDIAAIFARMPGTGPSPLQPLQPPAAFAAPDPGPALREGPVPGSIGLAVAQSIYLADDDVVVIGDFAGPLPAYRPDMSAVDSMLAEIDEFSGALSGPAPDDIFQTIPEFMAGAADAAYGMTASSGPVVVESATGADTQGITVDGVKVDAAPSLDDLLPVQPAEETPDTSGSVSLQTGDNTMVVASGQNFLANQASIVDAGLAPAIVAVAGDHVRLDIISQMNAYADNDTVDAGFPGGPAGGGTVTHNVAEFSNMTLDAQASAVAANPEAMPANWTVSVLEGDLVFLEWITQYTFASDNDLLVLTATGSTTNIQTGDNVTLNDISFADIGLYYDIVIIGGSLYDANIICQTNVLYDDDTLQMLCDADLSGSTSTSGNLLWNQASISRYGPQDTDGPLPGHYGDAMQALDQGNLAMPAGFADDPALAGYGHLRVLYVTGDVYDLRYIEQTNVLADADHVAVHAQGLLDNPDSEWTVSTGENALANVASITDYESAGETLYVGGQTYSDAVLIQAELVDTTSADDNGGLASELVAFLETEPAPVAPPEHYPAPVSHADAAPADVMQSVLA